jgi:hypothetical protein
MAKTSWAGKLKRSVKELMLGSKTYMPKDAEGRREKRQLDAVTRRTRKKQAEVYTSTRTSATESGLKKAGISSKKIKRMRDKY